MRRRSPPTREAATPMPAEQDPARQRTMAQQLKVLGRFIEVYCRRHHSEVDEHPCAECRDLLEYAKVRLEKCPYDPKPKCKECKTHCYRPEYRERIREVMRSSGTYFVRHGRLDWAIRYFMAEGAPVRRKPQRSRKHRPGGEDACQGNRRPTPSA